MAARAGAYIVELYDDAGGVRAWQVRWREGKRSPSKTFTTERAAEAHRARIITSKLDGTELDSALGRSTVEEYATEWNDAQPVAAPTTAKREQILRLHIFPRLGHRRLRAIRPTEVNAWLKAQRHLGISDNTLSARWDVLTAIFRAAVADRAIRVSPCDSPVVSAPGRANTKRPEPPSFAQLEVIAAELPARWRRLPLLIAHTGLRPSEALGLTVGQLDLRPGHAELTVDERGGSVKTRTSERTILLTRHAREVLELQLAEYGPGPGGRIFHHQGGRPILLNTVDRTWKAVLGRLGHPTAKGAAWHLHDLRHLNITSQLQAGAPPLAVMQAAGHSRLTTTELYGHVRAEDRVAAVRALERALDGHAPSRALYNAETSR